MLLRMSVFYVLTWIFLVVLGGIQQEMGIPSPDISLPQWGPGIAALLMILIFRKDRHTLVFFSKDTPAARYLAAVSIPAGAALLIWLIAVLLDIQTSGNPPAYASLPLFLLWMPFGALGEEIGWRGHLHKTLDSRMRGIVSSVVVGLLWMPIHLSFFERGWVMVFLLFLLITAYSITIFALVHDRGFDILLATIFHLSINAGNLLFFDIIYETPLMVINASVWVILAAIAVMRKPSIFLAQGTSVQEREKHLPVHHRVEPAHQRPDAD